MKTRHLKFCYGPSKKKGEFVWRIRAGNGEIIAQGEGYKRKRDALRVFDLLRVGFGCDNVDVVQLDKAGKPIPEPRYAGTLVSSSRVR